MGNLFASIFVASYITNYNVLPTALKEDVSHVDKKSCSVFENLPCHEEIQNNKRTIPKEWIKGEIVDLDNTKTINRVKQKQKEWNKVNTKTYTYIAHATVLDGPPALVFVQNNKVVKSLPLRGENLALSSYSPKENIIPKDFNISKIDDFKITKSKLTKTKSQYKWIPNINFYLIDNRFLTILKKNDDFFWKNFRYFDVTYDTRYSHIVTMKNFLSEMILFKLKKQKYAFNPLNFFSTKALLMLPKNTTFDTKTIQKILFLYQKTYKCINQKDANETKCMYKNLKWGEKSNAYIATSNKY